MKLAHIVVAMLFFSFLMPIQPEQNVQLSAHPHPQISLENANAETQQYRGILCWLTYGRYGCKF